MPLLKLFHISFVTLSLVGFIGRGLLTLTDSARRNGRWARTLPHINDTLLLVTGVALVVTYHWQPLKQPWLMTKAVALLAYIGIGSVAIGRRGGHGKWTRAVAGVVAVAVFMYIVSVAITKNPRPWLSF